jgi:hypothetical protein
MIRFNNWGEIDIKLAIDTLVEMFSCKSPSLPPNFPPNFHSNHPPNIPPNLRKNNKYE